MQAQDVRELIGKQGIEMDEETMRREATRWELHHGGISGRTAQQFVNHVIGKREQ